jgi:hypothetical protein
VTIALAVWTSSKASYFRRPRTSSPLKRLTGVQGSTASYSSWLEWGVLMSGMRVDGMGMRILHRTCSLIESVLFRTCPQARYGYAQPVATGTGEKDSGLRRAFGVLRHATSCLSK